MSVLEVSREQRDPHFQPDWSKTDVRSFPALHAAGELLDEYLPRMAALLERPHVNHRAEWKGFRDELDDLFAECGWTEDESRVAFDLLVAFAEWTSSGKGSSDD